MMNTLANAQRPARMTYEQSVQPTGPGRYRLLDVDFNPYERTLWARIAPDGPTFVSGELLQELWDVSAQIRAGDFGRVKFKVLSSRLPQIFSLGGDLELFLRLINERDRVGLFRYAQAAIDAVWTNVTGCGVPDLTSVAVVNGEAQGGGFEAALSCHQIVAETGTRFGFPESLFGLFPGMGAFALLAARTDASVAARLIGSASRYSAEFLYEIGVIDYLIPRGTSEAFIAKLSERLEPSRIAQRKCALDTVRYDALLSSIDLWVEKALGLGDKHKRCMTYLLNAQRQL